MPEKYKIFPGNKYFMDYFRVIDPLKKKERKENHMNHFGIKAIYLDLKFWFIFCWREYVPNMKDQTVGLK